VDIFQLFTLFKKQIEEREANLVETVTSGVKDWDEYKYLTGKLEALKSTKLEMQETMKRFEEHE
jgi:ATP-dependent protease HslVU (ClpYQ) peptidase subunit|tara:strand:+ start:120 stop:311 length:192 start_codon:yes stop_codon:yes gene_type:complete